MRIRRHHGCNSLSSFTLIIGIWVALFVLCSSRTASAQDASATFKAKCAICHGADATGKTPMGTRLNIPNLTTPEVQKLSDATLIETITKGKNNKMPAFGGKLTDAEIAQLKDYIRELGKKH